jgi:soluble lytic murein transglycosylase-like protein
MVVMPVFAAPNDLTTVVRANAKTGKLVRSTVVQNEPVADENLHKMIDRISAEQGIEAPLVHSVIMAESNYSATALSPKGAQGMMQLIPSTAKRFGVTDAFDPHDNIQGGVRYLKFLLDYYQGDYPKAIAAYNAGEKAVDKYKGIPPFAETRNYVSQVSKNLKSEREKQKVAAKPVDPAPAPATTTETYRPILASLGSDGRIYYRTP